MKLETDHDFKLAVRRLAQRSPESLARVLASFAYDSGPVGGGAYLSWPTICLRPAVLAERIDAFRPSRHRYVHRMEEAQIGVRLELILDAIESLVLPVDSRAAFELLVSLIERDGDAMELCGDHHYSVVAAVNRAIYLIAKAGRSLPAEVVRPAVERLVAEDTYATRESLIEVAADFRS